MSHWTVCVIGAGKIGKMIAALLHHCPDYSVIVADASEEALSSVGSLGVQTKKVDVSNPEDLIEAMRGMDAILSAAPFFLTQNIAQAALTVGAHYLDLTEDVRSTREVKKLAAVAESAFAPQCGLAPGFVSIAGNELAKSFNHLKSLTLRVGALPQFPTNKLKYNLTWSTEGLINEYCNPCRALRDGEPVELAPLEGYETFSLDGIDYEAFNTSGGLGSLAHTMQGRVENLRYLSIRYPGHRDLISLLLHDLGLINRRELLKEILETALPITNQDVVLIFIDGTGEINGSFEQRSCTYKIPGGQLFGETWSAIQITTAAGICATLDLIAQGVLPCKGFIRQEDISLERFLSNRFGALYRLDKDAFIGHEQRIAA